MVRPATRGRAVERLVEKVKEISRLYPSATGVHLAFACVRQAPNAEILNSSRIFLHVHGNQPMKHVEAPSAVLVRRCIDSSLDSVYVMPAT